MSDLVNRFVQGENIICQCGHGLSMHNNADNCCAPMCLCRCFSEGEEIEEVKKWPRSKPTVRTVRNTLIWFITIIWLMRSLIYVLNVRM